MVIRLRTAFLIGLGILILWFLYFDRDVLAPFIFAAIFAYIFNPLVDFFYHKIKLPRTLSILIIYFALISIFVILGVVLGRGIVQESSEFKSYMDNFLINTKHQISLLPVWIRPTINDTLFSLDKIRFVNSTSILEIFPKAVSRIFGFFIFLFSGFYFLKEGKDLISKSLTYVPSDHRVDVDILLRKINQVLNGYLRGQIFMIFLVSLVLFTALSIIGVKFSLLIAVFSGILEIIPIIGPIVAALMAMLITFITGSANFSLSPVQASILVIVVYFVVRQAQDYFVTPVIMGRITKLHPVIILFAVIAGGNSFGILGLILAVPIAAVFKLLLDFAFDKINTNETISAKK